jgi:branched-chain amino acid transport system permease protein
MSARIGISSLYLAILLALGVLPLVAGEFYVNLASQILIAVIIAASLNLLVGYGGLDSLGHAAFFGFAAYVCAWTSVNLGVSHSTAAILAILGATALAAAFGFMALRSTGLAFLMITLALSQVLWGLSYRWVSVTNGDNGISGNIRPALFGYSLTDSVSFYWFVLFVAVIALVFMALFIGSAFGTSLKATRDAPRRAAAIGFDVWTIRWVTFVYAGFWGGVSGLLYVYYHQFVHPSVLSLTNSVEVLLSVIVGGAGTFSGPIVGAVLVMMLRHLSSAYTDRWFMLMGFAFLFIILVLPEGIVPGVRRLLRGKGGQR